MLREAAHAGELRERVRVLQRGLDANGDPLGPFVEAFAVAAKIDATPGPMRVTAQRLEGQVAVEVTVRSTAATRAIDTSMRIVWLRTGATYNVSRPAAEAPRPPRAYVVFYATLHEGGEGG